MYDAIIIGAGSAGLSAALVLGRSLRRTLVLGAGPTRNAPATAVHSFFTRDGTPPSDLLAIGRAQLEPYETVEVRNHDVLDVRSVDGGFEVITSAGPVDARGLILACGVRDLLPDVKGVAELWGTGVLHCPYCHGWEVRDEPLAVYGNGEKAFDYATLIWNWSRDLVLCTDGPADLADDQREQLERRGIEVREQPIAELLGDGGRLDRIRFDDGSELARRALFLGPAQEPASDLGARLGCAHTDAGLIAVDEWGQTSVPKVFAAGDVATPLQQVSRASATGATAAAALNRMLTVEDFARRETAAPMSSQAR